MLLDWDRKFTEPTVANAFHVWVDIYAPMPLVFAYLSGAKELSTWWASKCESTPEPGGALTFVWEGEVQRSGQAFFRRYEPPNHLTIEWTHADGKPIPKDGSGPRGLTWPALNIYELAMLNDGYTRLHLHDMGLSAGDEFEGLRRATESGWREALVRLKRVVETRHSQDRTREKRRREQAARVTKNLE